MWFEIQDARAKRPGIGHEFGLARPKMRFPLVMSAWAILIFRKFEYAIEQGRGGKS
jgi:hypothetical protein